MPQSRQNEIEGLRKFLTEYGYEVTPELFEHIRGDDIIEVYSFPDMRQLFSNKVFREKCSYTELQMTTMPFTKLFWRSEEDNLRIVKRVQEVVKNEKGCVDWGIENHDLVESLHPKKRAFEMELRKIAPLLLKGETVGVISTCGVVLTFEWKENVD